MGREVGGRFKREGVYVYLWLIHVEVWQKTTKSCKAIILKLKKKNIFLRMLLACCPENSIISFNGNYAHLEIILKCSKTLYKRCFKEHYLLFALTSEFYQWMRDIYSAMHCRLVFMNTCNKGVSRKRLTDRKQICSSLVGRGMGWIRRHKIL